MFGQVVWNTKILCFQHILKAKKPGTAQSQSPGGIFVVFWKVLRVIILDYSLLILLIPISPYSKTVNNRTGGG